VGKQKGSICGKRPPKLSLRKKSLKRGSYGAAGGVCFVKLVENGEQVGSGENCQFTSSKYHVPKSIRIKGLGGGRGGMLKAQK